MLSTGFLWLKSSRRVIKSKTMITIKNFQATHRLRLNLNLALNLNLPGDQASRGTRDYV
jgi:hypothetical protein